jgi:hypothetical protein
MDLRARKTGKNKTEGFKISRGEYMPYLFISSFLLQKILNHLAFYKNFAYI